MIIEVDDLNVMREPRLIDAEAHHRGTSVPQMVYEIQHDFKAVYLGCGAPCAFLKLLDLPHPPELLRRHGSGR